MPGFIYSCSNCQCEIPVQTRYHCVEWDEFILCTKCFAQNGHHHKMKKFGYDIDTPNGEILEEEDVKLFIMRLMDSMNHAARCTNPHCQVITTPPCQEMKDMFLHHKKCHKALEHCRTCDNLSSCGFIHSGQCKNDYGCPVPFCCEMKIFKATRRIWSILGSLPVDAYSKAFLYYLINKGNT